MTINEAKKTGAVAYKSGKGRAPVMNSIFLSEISIDGNLVENGVALMKAYAIGWDVANLADGALDSSFPSVIEMNRIMA